MKVSPLEVKRIYNEQMGEKHLKRKMIQKCKLHAMTKKKIQNKTKNQNVLTINNKCNRGHEYQGLKCKTKTKETKNWRIKTQMIFSMT